MTANADVLFLPRCPQFRVANLSGRPAPLKLASKVNRVDDGVHAGAPVLQAGAQSVSQPPAPIGRAMPMMNTNVSSAAWFNNGIPPLLVAF